MSAAAIGVVDPITSLLWDCSFPCQAIINNRVTGQTTKASPSGSCFFTVHRFGYLSYSIRMILDHFFDKNQPLSVSIGSSTARFWFSVEVPSATAVADEDGSTAVASTNASGGGKGGMAAARKRTSFRVNDPDAVSSERSGAERSGGGGGGGPPAAAARNVIPVSVSKPFCVLIDELRCQLQNEADDFTYRQQQRAAAAASGEVVDNFAAAGAKSVLGAGLLQAATSEAAKKVSTRVLLDLPIRLVLNIDDSPPNNILSLGCINYERESDMILRQWQKMNCVHMYGSVKPFLMLDPSIARQLEEGCKKGDADKFMSARAQIAAKGMTDLPSERNSNNNNNANAAAAAAGGSSSVAVPTTTVGGADAYSSPNSPSSNTHTGADNSSITSSAIPITTPNSVTNKSITVAVGGGGGDGSKLVTTGPCVICFHVNGIGMAYRVIPHDSALARLGDVLRAYVASFAGLTDEQIMMDEPAPKHMGSVFLNGIEPSLCLPIDGIANTMPCLDLAVHIVVDTRSPAAQLAMAANGFLSSTNGAGSFSSSSGGAGSPTNSASSPLLNGSSGSFAVNPSDKPEAVVRAVPLIPANRDADLSGKGQLLATLGPESFYGNRTSLR